MVQTPPSHFDIITNYLREKYPKINSQNPLPAHTYPTCRRMQFLAKTDISDLPPKTIQEIITIHHQHIASETSWTDHNLRALDTPITITTAQPPLTIKQILTRLIVPHCPDRLPRFHDLTPPIMDASQNYKFPLCHILYPETRRDEVIAIMNNLPRALEVQFGDSNLAKHVLKPDVYDEYINQDKSALLNPWSIKPMPEATTNPLDNSFVTGLRSTLPDLHRPATVTFQPTTPPPQHHLDHNNPTPTVTLAPEPNRKSSSKKRKTSSSPTKPHRTGGYNVESPLHFLNILDSTDTSSQYSTSNTSLSDAIARYIHPPPVRGSARRGRGDRGGRNSRSNRPGRSHPRLSYTDATTTTLQQQPSLNLTAQSPTLTAETFLNTIANMHASQQQFQQNQQQFQQLAFNSMVDAMRQMQESQNRHNEQILSTIQALRTPANQRPDNPPPPPPTDTND